MGYYVVETDAPCSKCGDEHGCATSNCDLAVFVDIVTAAGVAKAIGGIVRHIEDVPSGISYMIFVQKDGKPNPAYPQTVSRI
jgi:hypothetical protein